MFDFDLHSDDGGVVWESFSNSELQVNSGKLF